MCVSLLLRLVAPYIDFSCNRLPTLLNFEFEFLAPWHMIGPRRPSFISPQLLMRSCQLLDNRLCSAPPSFSPLHPCFLMSHGWIWIITLNATWQLLIGWIFLDVNSMPRKHPVIHSQNFNMTLPLTRLTSTIKYVGNNEEHIHYDSFSPKTI